MTQIRRLAPDSDRAALTALFRSFDAKAHQQRVQGLDSDRLAAFLADGACKSSNPTWVADDAGALRGIASLQTKHWHTEHLGFPVGKLTQLMTAPDCEDVAAPFLDQIESTAREHGLHHLTGRTDAHAFRLQETLTARGWYPVGTSVKMAAQLNDVAQPPSAVSSVSSLPPELGEGLGKGASKQAPSSLTSPFPSGKGAGGLGPNLALRPATTEDRNHLLEIATHGHHENHLHFDPHLPSDATHAIFRRWVEKCLDGLAAQVWVLESPHDSPLTTHEPLGLCTILDPKSLNTALGTHIAVLDYIVLAPEAQGHGLGSQFLQAVHAKVAAAGFDQLELRTTATNFPAVNLYARHGYRLVGTDQVFGLWLGE